VFLVRATHLNGSPVALARDSFAQLPIRIGRNPLNDVCLADSRVSSFHARIEDLDGRPCLRDLGSKNGTFAAPDAQTAPTYLAAGTPIDLATVGFNFIVGAVRIQVEIVQGVAPPRSGFTGHVLANPNALEGLAPVGVPAYGGAPGSPPAGYAAGAAPPAWPGPMEAVPAPSRSLPSEGPRPNQLNTGFFNVGIDAMALQGLRELAASLTPGASLETTGDIARFITKLHDAVDVFCKCFVPLRDGYAQFVSSLDLRQAAFQRSINRSRASDLLETATSPDAVAMALLDPREPSLDAPAALEGILADLMLHQVALLDGVMQGVKALLDQLSPEAIEADLAAQHQLGLLGGNTKARWREYCERFERLAEGEQAFTLIFGRQFASAYRQYWQAERQTDTGGRGRTERPR
jgi:type VI secretion system protein ImpI